MLTDETLSIVSAHDREQEEAERELFEGRDLPYCLHHEMITECITAVASNDNVASKSSLDSLLKTLDLYLEQPFLLDPFLSRWMAQIVESFHKKIAALALNDKEWSDSDPVRLSCLCHIVYVFCKVRGVKTIMAHFKHSVEDVVPVLCFTVALLEREGRHEEWMNRYVAMLMGAMVLLIPFDLKRFKPRLEAIKRPGLISDLRTLLMSKLSCSGRERQAAVIALTNFHKRADGRHLIPNLLECCIQKLASKTADALGFLECVCALAKEDGVFTEEGSKAKIDELLHNLDQPYGNSSLLGKCRIKLYARLYRSLKDVNRCLEAQREALAASDTVVRWAGAKGLAKILKGLGPEASGQIVDRLMHCLETQRTATFPDPAVLHGTCLALAELSRCRSFATDRIPTILGSLPFLLRLEMPRGRFAVGGAVRDAACYILWSLCRSYNNNFDHAAGLIQTIGDVLVCVALFDREVNVRRAAAAAFQEMVGRWGCIEEGITLLGHVNFFSSHHQRTTFGTLALKVAEMRRYRYAMQRHLLEHALSSWDREIRQLASSLLAALPEDDDVTRKEELLARLIGLASQIDDLSALHGAILALSQMCKTRINLGDHVEAAKSVINISCLLTRLSPKMLGWEMIAEAVCLLIATLASSNHGLHYSLMNKDPVLLQCWFDAASLALHTRDDHLHQVVATMTLPALSALFPLPHPQASDYFRGIVLPAADKDRNINAQRGFALAVGAMPPWLFRERQGPVLRLLIKMVRATAPPNGSIEKRVNALCSLGTLLGKLEPEERDKALEQEEIQACLIESMDDYYVDSRGDIGSLIRSAALQQWPALGVKDNRPWVHRLIRHLFDKLDKLRLQSLQLLQLYSHLALPFDVLLASVYSSPTTFFAALRPHISLLTPFKLAVLEGLVSSSGSVNKLIVSKNIGD